MQFILKVFRAMANLLELLNYSMTFYIYCLFSEDFRNTLLRTMKWPWFGDKASSKRNNDVSFVRGRTEYYKRMINVGPIKAILWDFIKQQWEKSLKIKISLAQCYWVNNRFCDDTNNEICWLKFNRLGYQTLIDFYATNSFAFFLLTEKKIDFSSLL